MVGTIALDYLPLPQRGSGRRPGFVRQALGNTVFEMGLIENIIEVDNSPDFRLHFGLRHRF